MTAASTAGGDIGSRARLDVHNNLYRGLAALVAVYPFGVGVVSAPWLDALILVPAGALVVWRIAGVRLAEADDGALVVRNMITTRRLSPDRIDRLDTAWSFIDLRRDAIVVAVHLRPRGRRSPRRRIRCSASLTFRVEVAATTTASLAAWAEVHGVRCDVEPYRLVSGHGRYGAPPSTPATRWDGQLALASRRLGRELGHVAAGLRRMPLPEPAGPVPANTTGPVDPGAAVESAYRRVEAEAARVAARGGIDEADLHRLVLRALSAGLVHRSAAAAIEDVVALRRMVNRGELVPTATQARGYVDLADRQLSALRLPPRGLTAMAGRGPVSPAADR